MHKGARTFAGWSLGMFLGPAAATVAAAHEDSPLELSVPAQGEPQAEATAVDQDQNARLTALESEMQDLKSGSNFRVYWKDSLRFESYDKRFQMRLGGRAQNDWMWGGGDRDLENTVGKDEDGTEFRRARVYMSGTLYENLEFKWEYDFASGEPRFTDVYAAMTDIPLVGMVQIGHFKEPFGLEELTSSNDITFMERGLAAAQNPVRNAGVMSRNTFMEEHGTWAMGVFKDSDNFSISQDDGNWIFTGRATFLPVYEDDGATLVHAGVAYSFRNLNELQISSRPEVHLANEYVDTGTLSTEDTNLFGFELAGVLGPASLQAEYTWSRADIDTGSDPDFDGWYVQGSYWLTGEHRPYKTDVGAFGYTKPDKNFREEGGIGAWEVAARFSSLDLNNGAVKGGRIQDTTLGVNWHLNPNARVMMNYVHSVVDDIIGQNVNGQANFLQFRFQVAF